MFFSGFLTVISGYSERSRKVDLGDTMVEPVPEVVTPLVGLHVGVGQTLGEKMVHTESFS